MAQHKQEHSKGEWVLDGDFILCGSEPIRTIGRTSNDTNNMRPAEQKANGLLMAAAPKLLAALERIVGNEEHICNPDSSYCATNCMWAAALEAIEEAKGRA